MASQLAPGLVHIKAFLNVLEQQRVVDTVRDTGLGPAGFYVPTFEGDNHMNLRMFCYGNCLPAAVATVTTLLV